MSGRRSLAVVVGALLLAVVCSTGMCTAAEPGEAVRPVLEKLLKAVETNDYDSFVVDGTPEIKAGMTKQMLEGVSALMSPRMKKGYSFAYLGELKQLGCQVHLWELVYKDGGDDMLVKLVLKDGKVAGFWLQ